MGYPLTLSPSRTFFNTIKVEQMAHHFSIAIIALCLESSSSMSINVTRKQKMSTPLSPTLSDMELESPKLTVLTRPQMGTQTDTMRRLSRCLPTDGRDAFIGPLPPTAAETIRLVKKECPSLANVPEGDISLQLRFDGDTAKAVKNVLFRVLPEAWPAAVSEVLPLVHVSTKPIPALVPTPAPASGVAGLREKTWDDLKREGPLLGVQGWTDRGTGFGPNSD